VRDRHKWTQQAEVFFQPWDTCVVARTLTKYAPSYC